MLPGPTINAGIGKALRSMRKQLWELATDLGISQYINYSAAFLADLMVVEGQIEEGHQQLERALTAVRPMVWGRTVMFLFSLLAESYRRKGQTEKDWRPWSKLWRWLKGMPIITWN